MLVLALIQVIALENATVHSMRPGVEPEVATVLVYDGHFQEMGPDIVVPDDAIRVDLTGKHLMPGLIDGMIHHDLDHDPLYLLSGVTLARDMGNDLSRIFLAASPRVRNTVPGPELIVAGAIFDGVPPATTEAVIVRNSVEVLDKLPRLIDLGIHFASYHLGIPQEAWVQLIASARLSNVQVWGPIPRGQTLATVLEGKQDGVLYLEGFVGEEGQWDAEHAHELVMAYVENNVSSMPLLNVYGYRITDQGDDPPIFNLMAPYYADWWRADLEQRRSMFSEAYMEQGRLDFTHKQALVLDLWKSGVALVPGSAAPNPWMLPGEGLHNELAAWEAAGIPRDAILHMATLGCAQVLGVDHERGTIEQGKLADAIVLDGDPRESLEFMREPSGILMRGGFFEESYLQAIREGLHDAQLEALDAASRPITIEKPELPEGRVVLEGRLISKTLDRVTSAEEYWVVRCFEGDTAWCSRMVTRAGLGSDATSQTLIQRFDEGKLQSFSFEVNSGDMVFRVEGQTAAGQFRLKRWLNGEYVDTNATPRRPHLVDAGMALGPMLLSHYRPDGECSAIYFSGMDPILGDWALERRENGILAVRTSEGPLVATFHENGALDRCERAGGQSVVRFESERSTSFGGPGMPGLPYVPPAEKPAEETPVPVPDDGQ